MATEQRSQPQISLRSPREFVRIETEDGESLVAWQHHRSMADRCDFPPWKRDAPDQRAFDFWVLRRQEFGVLAPYFRGYGESSGYPTERGLRSTAAAVYRYGNSLYPSNDRALGLLIGQRRCCPACQREESCGLGFGASFTSLIDLAKSCCRSFQWILSCAIAFTRCEDQIRHRSDIDVHGEADREYQSRLASDYS